jgi:hypothetical protein
MARSPRYGDTVEGSDAYLRLQQIIILVKRDDLPPASHAYFAFALSRPAHDAWRRVAPPRSPTNRSFRFVSGRKAPYREHPLAGPREIFRAPPERVPSIEISKWQYSVSGIEDIAAKDSAIMIAGLIGGFSISTCTGEPVTEWWR